ncbi:6834_t:CDS:2, partial [Gigaspora rosea]
GSSSTDELLIETPPRESSVNLEEIIISDEHSNNSSESLTNHSDQSDIQSDNDSAALVIQKNSKQILKNEVQKFPTSSNNTKLISDCSNKDFQQQQQAIYICHNDNTNQSNRTNNDNIFKNNWRFIATIVALTIIYLKSRNAALEKDNEVFKSNNAGLERDNKELKSQNIIFEKDNENFKKVNENLNKQIEDSNLKIKELNNK